MGWKIGDKITVDPGDNDLVPLQQGDNTRNSTLARIKKFFLGDEKLKTTAQTITGAINENTAQMSEKMQLYIGQTLPAMADRKEKTMYLKITDTISNGTTDNIKVSPTMGLKIV